MIEMYGFILCVVNPSANMTLILIDEQRWEPTFGSIGLTLIGVLSGMALKAQLPTPEAEGLATSALARQ